MTHELGTQTTCIDTRHLRPNAVAAYLIQEGDYAAFVNPGCCLSVPRLLQALDDKRENVLYILSTHIHLDHAGSLSGLIKYLPNATADVHDREHPSQRSPQTLK